MTTPKVSIGVPVYNCERLIENAIGSLLEQSFPDIEIVVCDNASTDSTPEICRQLQQDDPRIRYFRNDVNLGVTANYNRVAELSRGKYLKWAAANDTCHPSYVAECVDVLDSEPDVVLCHGRTRFIMDDGTEQDYDGDFAVMESRPSERWRKVLDRLRKNNAMNGLIRRETLMRTLMLGPYAWSDMTTMCELSLYGKFQLLPDVRFYRSMEAGTNSMDLAMSERRALYEPQSLGKLQLPAWRELYEHGWGVARAPIPVSEKQIILRHVFRLARWRRDVLLGEVLGAGKWLLAQARPGASRQLE
jgi:glycosyltransferase involved in cell wall biosynthesis